MTEQKTFIFDGEEPLRIDVFLSVQMDISRTAATRLLEQGNAAVNGREVPKNYKLSSGDRVEVLKEECVESDILPEDIPLDILLDLEINQ